METEDPYKSQTNVGALFPDFQNYELHKHAVGFLVVATESSVKQYIIQAYE